MNSAISVPCAGYSVANCLMDLMVKSLSALSLVTGAAQSRVVRRVAFVPAIPLLRDAQMAALALGGVGYGVNADHGAGCDIHPPPKQYCAKRLANSTVEITYGQKVGGWQSPTYKECHRQWKRNGHGHTQNTAAGLTLLPSANVGILNCTKLLVYAHELQSHLMSVVQ